MGQVHATSVESGREERDEDMEVDEVWRLTPSKGIVLHLVLEPGERIAVRIGDIKLRFTGPLNLRITGVVSVGHPSLVPDH